MSRCDLPLWEIGYLMWCWPVRKADVSCDFQSCDFHLWGADIKDHVIATVMVQWWRSHVISPCERLDTSCDVHLWEADVSCEFPSCDFHMWGADIKDHVISTCDGAVIKVSWWTCQRDSHQIHNDGHVRLTMMDMIHSQWLTCHTHNVRQSDSQC